MTKLLEGPSRNMIAASSFSLAAAAAQRRLRGEPSGEALGVRPQLRGHLRREEPGRDGVHADLVAAPLRGQLAGKADDPGLRRDVGRIGHLAERAQPHHGGDVDDRTAAAGPHLAGDEARERERRSQVQVDDAREVLGAQLQRGARRAHPGVVDESVDAAVALHHSVHQALAVGGVGDVARHGHRLRDGGGKAGQPVGPARSQNRNRAGGGEAAGELLAEPRARTGHDHDAARKLALAGLNSIH